MPMKIQTIYLSDRVVESVDLMVEMGLFPSRSEFVRVALQEFVPGELERFAKLDPKYFEKIKKDQLKLYFEKLKQFKKSRGLEDD